MMPDYRQDNPYQNLLANALLENDITVIFCQGYRRVLPIYRQVITASTPIDVLHIHWLNPYLKGDNWIVKFIYCLKFLLDIFLVRKKGIRIVWTIHNLVAHDSRFPRLEKWLKQYFLFFVDCAIVHSQAAKDAVVDAYSLDKNKVVIIPHGHYRAVYGSAIAKQEARQKLNLPNDRLLLLNFGMLKPYKGVEKVVDIWNNNSEIAQNCYFLIAGKALDKSYGQHLKMLVEKVKGVELRDKFVADEEVHLYFSAADVVILPFKQILTSGSLLLAISYGKPVIAPQLENILETLGAATAFLYDPFEDGALIGAIQASIDADLAIEAQKVIAAGDRLNWDDIALKTKKIYQS